MTEEDKTRYAEFLGELTKLSQKFGVSIACDKDGMHLSDGGLWYGSYMVESGAGSSNPVRVVSIYQTGS